MGAEALRRMAGRSVCASSQPTTGALVRGGLDWLWAVAGLFVVALLCHIFDKARPRVRPTGPAKIRDRLAHAPLVVALIECKECGACTSCPAQMRVVLLSETVELEPRE